MIDANYFNDVAAWHAKMRCDYEGDPRELPTAYDSSEKHHVMCCAEMLGLWQKSMREMADKYESQLMHRLAFQLEELREQMEAIVAEDLEGQLDAIVDQIYVLCGTARMQGFPLNHAWERVHAANMQKRAGSGGITNKIIKPEGWQAPDHSDLVEPGPWRHPLIPDPE